MKPSLNRYRAGLAIGGPIIKNRTFYYGAGEEERTREQKASDINSQSAAEINRVLSAGLLGGASVTSGLFPTELTETELSAKLTHQITARELLMARAASTSTHDRGDAFNTGGLVDVSGRGTRRTTDVAATGTWTSILSNHLTHEARVQVASRQTHHHALPPIRS